ncbi:type II secretion system F family protein [Zhongshania sp.]|uniref:type II secretion system F family protein n=1 Tax=Zhongshania sp. TaxID=1971902 RepID=UPI003569C1FF
MEVHHYYFIFGAIVLCTAPVFLLVVAHMDTKTESPQTVEGFSPRDTWRQLREENTHIASLSQLLRRAGLFNSEQQLNAITVTLIGIASLTVIVAALAFYRDLAVQKIIFVAIGTFITSLLFAYLFLKKAAEDRQKLLEKESMMLIQTTRMLWRVGLSLPKTLSIICQELHELSPNCATELNIAVKKIEAGQSQEEALYELINSCSAEGFKEYLIVIRQQSITGGSIDSSLDELYVLLQNRRRLDLQEQVNKLSGKMSLVMMVFLFPALLLFVAGPGMFSISKSLSGLGG